MYILDLFDYFMPLSVVHGTVTRASSGVSNMKCANHYANFAGCKNLILVFQCILLVSIELRSIEHV